MSRVRIRKPTFVVLCLLLALVVLSPPPQSAVAAPTHPAQAAPGGWTSPPTGANADLKCKSSLPIFQRSHPFLPTGTKAPVSTRQPSGPVAISR